jgi:hypothetical protein
MSSPYSNSTRIDLEIPVKFQLSVLVVVHDILLPYRMNQTCPPAGSSPQKEIVINKINHGTSIID